MKDYIVRATAADGAMRAFVAATQNTVNEAVSIHSTTPVVSAALGRLLTAASIMGLMLGNESDLMTLNIKGDGGVGGLLATADGTGNVKGYAYDPDADIPNKPNGKLDVSGIIGEGTLTVIKDMGMKEPYVGQVALATGEIAEDIAFYFAKSEQTPSVVSLGVLVDVDYSIRQSGGFVIQLMPGAEDEIIDKLEKEIADFPSMTSLLENGKTPEDILNMLLGGFGYEITEMVPVSYACNCSQERVEKALISIGEEELIKIIKEDKKASLNCHFCNKTYHFSENDLIRILEAAKSNK